MSKSEVMVEFPDLNGNNIPDAFENRPSITEILHDEFDGWESNETVLARNNATLARDNNSLTSELKTLQKENAALARQLQQVGAQLRASQQREAELKAPFSSSSGRLTVTVEIEKEVRSANAGEWVLTLQGLVRCPQYDHNLYRGYIVKRILKESM